MRHVVGRLARGESVEIVAADAPLHLREARLDLRSLALAVRDKPGMRAVVLGGAPEGGGVALGAAVAKGSGCDAGALIADAARTVGGGGGRNPDLAVAGGKDPSRLDEALGQVRSAAGIA